MSGTALDVLAAEASQHQLPPRWKDCPDICPPTDELMKALQDTGKVAACRTKVDKEKGMKLTKYDLVMKVAAFIYRKIKDLYRPVGLTENGTRGKQALVIDILNSRKAFVTLDVRIEFHQYNRNGKVLLINNTFPCGGVEASVERFQEHIEHSVRKKDVQRTPDDSMRCAAIMLDPKYRGTVSGTMSNKKDRSKSDIAGDHVENFFCDTVIDFLNPSYSVNQPKEENFREFPEEDRSSWDPNSTAIMEHERDGKWLMDTWFQHITPKYRQSLNKWNKDAGGGSGEVSEFINYCNHDRWLGWVFALDFEAFFLLAASTCGMMPRHLQMESGFEDDDVSDLENETDTRASASTSKSARTSRSNKSIKDDKKSYSELNNLISQIVKSRSEPTKCPDTPENPSFHFCMERAAYYRKEIKAVADDGSLTPETKGITLRMLGNKKKRLYKLAEAAESRKHPNTTI